MFEPNLNINFQKVITSRVKPYTNILLISPPLPLFTPRVLVSYSTATFRYTSVMLILGAAVMPINKRVWHS